MSLFFAYMIRKCNRDVRITSKKYKDYAQKNEFKRCRVRLFSTNQKLFRPFSSDFLILGLVLAGIRFCFDYEDLVEIIT